MRSRQRRLAGLALAGVIFGADQWLKYCVSTNMELGESIVLLGPLRLTYVHNTGAAFSLLAGNTALLAAFSAFILGGIGWLIFKAGPQDIKMTLTLAALAGGASGNLYDRAVHRYVVDYLDVGFWPVFNLADIAIVFACGLLVWQVWQKERGSGG